MVVHRLTRERVFEPDVVQLMGRAYDCALGKLGLNNCHDPACELVATKIIEIVEGGTRDARRVCEQTVAAFLELDIAHPVR